VETGHEMILDFVASSMGRAVYPFHCVTPALTTIATAALTDMSGILAAALVCCRLRWMEASLTALRIWPTLLELLPAVATRRAVPRLWAACATIGLRPFLDAAVEVRRLF
jgi:hypothetical protein